MNKNGNLMWLTPQFIIACGTYHLFSTDLMCFYQPCVANATICYTCGTHHLFSTDLVCFYQPCVANATICYTCGTHHLFFYRPYVFLPTLCG
jgi:hypothetical protein